jgi:hypothetical protein
MLLIKILHHHDRREVANTPQIQITNMPTETEDPGRMERKCAIKPQIENKLMLSTIYNAACPP